MTVHKGLDFKDFTDYFQKLKLTSYHIYIELFFPDNNHSTYDEKRMPQINTENAST